MLPMFQLRSEKTSAPHAGGGGGGGGVFGVWGEDPAGMPAFMYTLDQTRAPAAGDYSKVTRLGEPCPYLFPYLYPPFSG